MRMLFLIILFTFSILLIIGIIQIGRELRRIRALLDKGAERLEGYLTIILSDESSDRCKETEPEPFPEAESQAELRKGKPDGQGLQLTNEEKKMLWSSETRQLFDEIMGDIF
ncbi:MAG: hypothetical protein ACI39H_09355 [Lachnospiraceae bacterium]